MLMVWAKRLDPVEAPYLWADCIWHMMSFVISIRVSTYHQLQQPVQLFKEDVKTKLMFWEYKDAWLWDAQGSKTHCADFRSFELTWACTTYRYNRQKAWEDSSRARLAWTSFTWHALQNTSSVPQSHRGICGLWMFFTFKVSSMYLLVVLSKNVEDARSPLTWRLAFNSIRWNLDELALRPYIGYKYVTSLCDGGLDFLLKADGQRW